MSVVGSTVQLPQPIALAARSEADRIGVSLEDWLAATVAQRLNETEAAQTFFRSRASGARRGALRDALDAIPDREPDPEDF